MEPVTHLLTGACLARSGFHRRVAYATTAMAIAAEFPDIDTVWSLRGPISGFEHHRGITHTFLGVPFEAGLLLLAFIAWHRWRQGRSAPGTKPLSRSAVAVRWGALYLLILLALLSHLLLDFTNNYGLRPFLPFNDRWYAASIVFIFDPLIFVLLTAGLLLPALFGLIGREVGVKDQSVASSGWARAALTAVVMLWVVRSYEHGRAIELANRATLRAPATAVGGELLPPELVPAATDTVPADPAQAGPLLQPLHTLASPDPLSFFRWYTATDFGSAIQLGTADSHLQTLVSGRLLVKPPLTPALTTAESSRLGKIYLDWSPMPYLRIESNQAQDAGEITHTVYFQDPRFMADTAVLHNRGKPPLTGTVLLGADGRVLAAGMDGRLGR